MTKKSSCRVRDDLADPILYRTYFKIMLPDILIKNGWEVTQENKERLHERHKKILGYESIAGKSHEFVSFFLFEVCVWWAVEKGLFVRTSRKQMEYPHNIEDRSFLEVKDLL
jgi:hypothetical protein